MWFAVSFFVGVKCQKFAVAAVSRSKFAVLTLGNLLEFTLSASAYGAPY